MRWPARWRRPVRLFGDLAILAILGYGAAIAYLYAYQVELVFRPPAHPMLYTTSLGLQPERVVVTNRAGLATEAWRIRAAGGNAPNWVLFLHGNAAAISSGVNMRRYDQLRGLGLNVFAIEYPGFGNVGGQASEAGMHAAARAAYDHLRQVEGIPPAHIAIYGWSLGSGAAVPLARDVDEAVLVLEGAFTSVLARAREQHPFMPVAWLLAHPFRSEDAITATHSPTLFLHSPEDVVIPFHHGQALFAKAAGPKRLVPLAGGHIYANADDADRYTAGLYGFLTEIVGWRLTPPKRSVGVAVSRALATQGIDPALATWRGALTEGDERWSLAEYELQHVGRRHTLIDDHAVAIAVLRANRDRFPASPMAWFELGRALAAGSHRDDARRAFLRSLALDPIVINPSHEGLAALD